MLNMKVSNALVAARPINNLAALQSVRPSLLSRTYATTQNNTSGASNIGPKRRSVTPFNDDGYVSWTNLSAGEKAARATQQSFNFGMVIVGLVLTVCATGHIKIGPNTNMMV